MEKNVPKSLASASKSVICWLSCNFVATAGSLGIPRINLAMLPMMSGGVHLEQNSPPSECLKIGEASFDRRLRILEERKPLTTQPRYRTKPLGLQLRRDESRRPCDKIDVSAEDVIHGRAADAVPR